MRVLMIVALAMCLVGCAGSPALKEYTAQNPARQTALNQDVAQCRYEAEAGSVAAGAGARGAIEVEYRKVQARDSLFVMCMNAKGWQI